MARILWLMTGSLVAGGGENPRLGLVEISGMVGVMMALGAVGALVAGIAMAAACAACWRRPATR